MTEPVNLAAFREHHLDLIGERKPRDWGGCQHRKHIVDVVLRRVTCADCGETLDPIEVLLHYVDYWHGVKHELQALVKFRQEYQQRERDKQDRTMARKVAKYGGVWACDVARHYDYWEAER